MTIGATVDIREPMRVRVLVLGLAFFGFAVALAVQPYVASGHNPNLNKPCTIVGHVGARPAAGNGGQRRHLRLAAGPTPSAGTPGTTSFAAARGTTAFRATAAWMSSRAASGDDWLWARDGRHDHVKGGRGYDRYRYDQSIDRLRSVEALM